MKKIVAMLLAALMLLTVVGCGGGTAQTAKKYVVLSDKLAAEEYGIGFRKGSTAVAQVNAAIEAIAADGTLAALAAPYGLDANLIVG